MPECSKLSTHCPLPVTEAANIGVLKKKGVLKISQNSQQTASARVSF